jgi:lysophospholipase L1-like esterase
MMDGVTNLIGVRRRIALLAQCVVALGLLVPVATCQPFALKDGDTVVFYGDSITAQRLYTKFAEEFALTRYPAMQVRFVNAGVPGDTTFGGYAGAMPERVHRDVEPFHPAMITVMLGMNDGGYGYTPTATVDANFLKGYNLLLDALHKAAPGATLTLINPTPYDEITHGTEFPGYSGLIDHVSEQVSTIAVERQAVGEPPVLRVDFHAPMVEALTRAKAQFPELAPLIIPDRIHPADAGHWMMAVTLMKAWHVDPVVSRVVLDAKGAGVVEKQRAVVTKLASTTNGLAWTQLDEALPLPLDFNNAMTKVLLGVSNIVELDQQMLRVDGLATGRYQLLIDAKPIATFSSDELRHGVNLALVKTPMWEQARGIDFSEDRRATLQQARFVLSEEVKTTATSAVAEDKLREADEELAVAIRAKIVPKPHDFELRRQ